MLGDVNWLAIVVGALGYQVLGALWYGQLFDSMWMDAMGYDSTEDVEDDDPTVGYAMTGIGAIVAAIALSVVVDWAAATTWLGGLTVGGLVGVGFVATTGVQSVPFEGRSWTVYAINAGYNVVALAGLGALLAVW
jgi:hypothetical protein